MDSGRWFRFVGTTVKVPATGACSHYARVVLKGQNVAWARAWGIRYRLWAASGTHSVSGLLPLCTAAPTEDKTCEAISLRRHYPAQVLGSPSGHKPSGLSAFPPGLTGRA
jgi:hypothetical protein